MIPPFFLFVDLKAGSSELNRLVGNMDSLPIKESHGRKIY